MEEGKPFLSIDAVRAKSTHFVMLPCPNLKHSIRSDRGHFAFVLFFSFMCAFLASFLCIDKGIKKGGKARKERQHAQQEQPSKPLLPLIEDSSLDAVSSAPAATAALQAAFSQASCEKQQKEEKGQEKHHASI
jgi:hypothetical protein